MYLFHPEEDAINPISLAHFFIKRLGFSYPDYEQLDVKTRATLYKLELDLIEAEKAK